jgi:hypothetical protein
MLYRHNGNTVRIIDGERFSGNKVSIEHAYRPMGLYEVDFSELVEIEEEEKVQVRHKELVAIYIKGVYREPLRDGSNFSNLPRTPDDKGVVGKVLDFCIKERLFTHKIAHSGGGQYLAYFEKEDAEKVLAFVETLEDVEIEEGML